MENDIFIITDSDGWFYPFYFTTFKLACERLRMISGLRGKRCKVVKLEMSCFNHEY